MCLNILLFPFDQDFSNLLIPCVYDLFIYFGFIIIWNDNFGINAVNCFMNSISVNFLFEHFLHDTHDNFKLILWFRRYFHRNSSRETFGLCSNLFYQKSEITVRRLGCIISFVDLCIQVFIRIKISSVFKNIYLFV